MNPANNLHLSPQNILTSHRMILGCIYSKKLLLKKKQPVNFQNRYGCFSMQLGFQKLRHKKRRSNLISFLVAPQVGLEPTTYGLTVRRSNQLSY